MLRTQGLKVIVTFNDKWFSSETLRFMINIADSDKTTIEQFTSVRSVSTFKILR